eukprot:11200727-Lingulodinium_polyedra.AAC.1
MDSAWPVGASVASGWKQAEKPKKERRQWQHWPPPPDAEPPSLEVAWRAAAAGNAAPAEREARQARHAQWPQRRST